MYSILGAILFTHLVLIFPVQICFGKQNLLVILFKYTVYIYFVSLCYVNFAYYSVLYSIQVGGNPVDALDIILSSLSMLIVAFAPIAFFIIVRKNYTVLGNTEIRIKYGALYSG